MRGITRLHQRLHICMLIIFIDLRYQTRPVIVKKRTPASVRVTYIFMNELDLSHMNHAESLRVFHRIGVAAFHFPTW